ncbi:osmotically inducible protein OsmC [candidate division KSB3 bacterium]|uniref:Osmotically inducible protein OsmC n=1 Tax=candidate division KSB3 bacterium TaxID=2044937 RepID=A0A2G6KBR2_9BACT|nr:MAG: osmotically inducible protein OsmC [candidate division KSB3 bacterium]
MKIQAKQVKGITFAMKGGSNHWVMSDGPEEFDGAEAASRPMEFILFGFAGCAGSDIVSILKKMRSNVARLEIDVDAENAAEHPKVFTNIHLTFSFAGKGVKDKDVERAIEMTRTKYCPVWSMLKESVEITYEYHIEEL